MPEVSRTTPPQSIGEPASSGAKRATRSSRPTARPLRILVVEDDFSAREGLARAIRLLGYACLMACDGEEAWSVLQQEHVDVVVSDWHMPRMDGVELCKRIRARVESAYVYFVLMTDFGDKAHFLEGMNAGADDFHAKPIDIDELQARLVCAGRVLSIHEKLREKNASLRHDSQASFRLARVDPLTAIPNRLAMCEELEALWARMDRYGHRYSMAICDVDFFKVYNDHFGHLAGDSALRRVAHTLRQELRQGDTLFRYGGEEFLVVLPEQSSAEAVLAMNRMRAAVERLAIPNPSRGVVTISAGVAELSDGDDASDDWLRRADDALYRAKSGGRNRVEAAPSSSRLSLFERDRTP